MGVGARVNMPKKFKPQSFKTAYQIATVRIADGVEDDFKATTATWKHQVKFESEIKSRGSGIFPVRWTVIVFTDDEIYSYVNDGTEPHDIKPVHAKILAFPGGKYKAKTTPKKIGSQTGGPSGSTVFRMKVRHPGTDAREFDVVIKQKWQKRVPEEIADAMSAAVKACGHEYK